MSTSPVNGPTVKAPKLQQKVQVQDSRGPELPQPRQGPAVIGSLVGGCLWRSVGAAPVPLTGTNLVHKASPGCFSARTAGLSSPLYPGPSLLLVSLFLFAVAGGNKSTTHTTREKEVNALGSCTVMSWFVQGWALNPPMVGKDVHVYS